MFRRKVTWQSRGSLQGAKAGLGFFSPRAGIDHDRASVLKREVDEGAERLRQRGSGDEAVSNSRRLPRR